MKIWGIWKENLNLEIEPLWWEYGGKISKIQDFLISTSVRHYHEISTQIPPGEFHIYFFRLQVMSLEVFFNALTDF